MPERETIAASSLTEQIQYWKDRVDTHKERDVALSWSISPLAKVWQRHEIRYAQRILRENELARQMRRELFLHIKTSPRIANFYARAVHSARRVGAFSVADALAEMRARSALEMYDQHGTPEWEERYPALARMIEQTALVIAEPIIGDEQIDLTVARAESPTTLDLRPVRNAYRLLDLSQEYIDHIPTLPPNFSADVKLRTYVLPESPIVKLDFTFVGYRKRGILNGINTNHVPARVSLRISKRPSLTPPLFRKPF
ncbi:hypothetical protein A3G67_01350 [Candidatus Roizmanbacteria bacterium RIFCSPLOWO2_12_FULL_40_12]|uniref:Uncharacterized protein n=1 Tax=Candidatus Roizmanbacteria bacterium RIFCSPLOWO2_01_FULL_40_42 TaxID=1802066 RepID=A0A1F7J555_9BACT|nr:MAG: hypothetical protein A2779_01825 [Candidatus Roizmanbacteria bacterium RIFCSPHIGHO2_01_FULL_40_98]OGK28548.1 MAG: hypothetical protein A3C31_01145 [Candidatus Roizmanbacteria bacterium RIFCSPHIGHO2_02_FULL_40_53]OGK30418.1 MAG: hypothetical protein A2W49_00880 [Candidatus Roizmanbacteria bacterium RIFCSPHIGHO2_12_41_18]OGK36551.1 MAG: hypothetical protein A3E69_03415 [Candidatus Roizmanbacteria bacterium RIFCSPHIGHO2_12_FULL_40_130]OGK50736.1 MAG: hypothetical protein A3B50_04535 [Candi